MSLFVQKILSLQKESGISERKFAEKIGVGYGAYRGWVEQGSEPSADKVETILKNLGGDITRAFPGYEPPADLLRKYASPIRVLGEVSAGHASINESPIEYEDAILGTLKNSRYYPYGTGDIFALRVRGDSMEPTYLNGSLIGCRAPGRHFTELRQGTPVVFTDNYGNSTFKNFHYNPEKQKIYGLPINRDHDVHEWKLNEVKIQAIALGSLQVNEQSKNSGLIMRDEN